MTCCIVGLRFGLIILLFVFSFLSFKAKFVSQCSQELYKLASSNIMYICGINGIETQGYCSYFFNFFIHFLSFPIC